MLLMIVRDSKRVTLFPEQFSSLNICHQHVYYCNTSVPFEILSSPIIPTPLVLIILWTFMTVQDYLLKFRKISSSKVWKKLYDHLNYT